jgi:polyhydroxyalkanoate synthesis regulator phasin
MPQPRKPGSSSGRKPPARKSAAPKTSRSPAKPHGAKRSAGPSAKRPASSSASAKRPASAPAAASATREARAQQQREDQLHAAAASLRDLLSKGVVITADRLQETVDEAVRLGRMTREDAEELVRNLVEIGRRQTQDTLAEVESILGNSAKETRRQVRARLKSVGAAARNAPGGDRAMRTVDRVRRAAGLGHALPIAGYEELTTAQVKERLMGLDEAELREVREHERRNANRKSVLTAIEKRLS